MKALFSGGVGWHWGVAQSILSNFYWEVRFSSKWFEDVDAWGWFSMMLIIYDVQLGIIGLKQVFFFRSIRRYFYEVFEMIVFQTCQGSFCCFYILQTFEADFLHSASQPYHTPYIVPVHIYRLTMRNHVSDSVLLSPVPFSHGGTSGLGIFVWLLEWVTINPKRFI